MPQICNNKNLSYNIDFLYNIIIDVEKYNEFIPWCDKIVVVSKDEDVIVSDVTVKFMFIKEHYRSIAMLKPSTVIDSEVTQANVDIKMLYGPFSHFYTSWILTKIHDNETRIDFTCDFAFNNHLYNSIAAAVLYKANSSIFKAFEQRALRLSTGF